MRLLTHTNTLFVLLLLACLISASCGSDDPSGPTVQELTFEKLAGSWTFGTNGSIVLDGQDISANYPGFALSFADGTYTTTNAGDLFEASGTWQWTSEQATSVLLDTGVEVTIIDLSETAFRFSFTHAGTGGTAAGTAGNYTITLEK